MIMLYAVRVRLVFISSVTARTPLRTISVSTAAFGKGGKASSAKQAPMAAPIRAMQLLGRWTRLAQGHIAFGGGCSCCGEFGNLQVMDMEQHILDYLDTKYRAANVE